MSVLDLKPVPLSATATYPRREAAITPAELPDEWVLVIRLWRSLSPDAEPERDVYHVQEEAGQVGVIGRSFLLLNLTDGEQPDVYRTTAGRDAVCTCKAGLCRVSDSCKHRDALTALITERRL